MYNRFYGLVRAPFAITPDPSLLYESPGHLEALATILYGVETRKGFIVCTGEVGTGKTTILRAFFTQVDAVRFKIIDIPIPQLTAFQVARLICNALGLGRPRSRVAGLQAIQAQLLRLYEERRIVVLVIDEAQAMPPDTLEFLRILSNFDSNNEKLLQIVLVGQPELDQMLARPELRQVSQRVAHYARLDPLTLPECVNYIRHRLVAAGADQPEAVLTRRAIKLIARASGGIPRRINVLADNVLIGGFGASEHPVAARRARVTIRESGNRARRAPLDIGRRSSLLGLPARIGALAATAAAAVIIIWQLGGLPAKGSGEVRSWQELLPGWGLAAETNRNAPAASAPLPAATHQVSGMDRQSIGPPGPLPRAPALAAPHP